MKSEGVWLDACEFIDRFCDEVHRVAAELSEREDWFRSLWEENEDVYEFYELAQEISPNVTLGMWEKAWAGRVILHPDYETAKVEFVNAMAGWY